MADPGGVENWVVLMSAVRNFKSKSGLKMSFSIHSEISAASARVNSSKISWTAHVARFADVRRATDGTSWISLSVEETPGRWRQFDARRKANATRHGAISAAFRKTLSLLTSGVFPSAWAWTRPKSVLSETFSRFLRLLWWDFLLDSFWDGIEQ